VGIREPEVGLSEKAVGRGRIHEWICPVGKGFGHGIVEAQDPVIVPVGDPGTTGGVHRDISRQHHVTCRVARDGEVEGGGTEEPVEADSARSARRMEIHQHAMMIRIGDPEAPGVIDVDAFGTIESRAGTATCRGHKIALPEHRLGRGSRRQRDRRAEALDTVVLRAADVKLSREGGPGRSRPGNSGPRRMGIPRPR